MMNSFFKKINLFVFRLTISSITLFLFGVLFGAQGFAGGLDNYPGLTPLDGVRRAAGDLVCNHKVCLKAGFKLGQRISSEQADNLQRKYNLDLSVLSPDPTSDLWSDSYVLSDKWKAKNTALDKMSVKSGDLVDYSNETFGLIQESRHVVDYGGEKYLINFGIKNHNYILRKSLLRKIGYNTPSLKRFAKLKVRFKNSLELKAFTKKFYNDVKPVDPRRWILNIKKTVTTNEKGQEVISWEGTGPEGKNNILIMQDLTVSSIESNIIDDLYAANLKPWKVLNRRLLRSLLLLYELVDVPESVNLLKWESGNIISQGLLLDYQYASEFYPSIEDLQWIIRRISKLARSDWEDIVNSVGYPVRNGGEPVSKLLVEKLISRRNFLQRVLLKESCQEEVAKLECQPLEVSYNVSEKKSGLLKNGSLLLETTESIYTDFQNPEKWWVGYGSRFSFGPNESPLGGEQLWALAKSKFKSNLISNLMTKINNELRTDLAQKALEQQKKSARKQLIKAIKTGAFEKVPFGFWVAPTVAGNLIVSREIIAGSYLGADNKIQLADSFGYAADAGFFVGTEGVKPGWFVSGDLKALVFKNFVHLRPVSDMKSANEMKMFPDIAVHKVLRDIAGPLDVLLTENFKSLDEEAGSAKKEDGSADPCECSEKEKITRQIVTNLKKVINIGESFIVTTNIGQKGSINVGYGITDQLKAFAAFKEKFVEVSRVHIMRKSDDNFYIYHSKGDILTFSGSLSLKFFIPVFSLGAQAKTTSPLTKFFNVSLNKKVTNTNERLVNNLLGLRESFSSPFSAKLFSFSSDQATQHFTKENPYYTVSHDAKETSFNFRMFAYNWLSVKSYDEIVVKSPPSEVTGKQYDQTFVRQTLGERNGIDYQTLSLDVINAIIQESVDDGSDISVSSANSGRPSETFKGSSTSRQASLEAVAKGGLLTEPFVNIAYRWKGWNAPKKKILKMVKELNSKFKATILPESYFNNVDALELYTIEGNLNVYRRGLEYMASLSYEKVSAVRNKYLPKTLSERIKKAMGENTVEFENVFRRYQKKYIKSLKKKDVKAAAKWGLKMVSYAESLLPFSGFKVLVGGDKNYYAQSKVYGFRVGGEGREDFLNGDTIGVMGSDKSHGPIKREVAKMGMTESEFYIYWILNKL